MRDLILPFFFAQAAEVLAGEATNNKTNVFRNGWLGKSSHISNMTHLWKFCLHDLDSWAQLIGNPQECHSQYRDSDPINFYINSDATVMCSILYGYKIELSDKKI
jgi:hypothetical protein